MWKSAFLEAVFLKLLPHYSHSDEISLQNTSTFIVPPFPFFNQTLLTSIFYSGKTGKDVLLPSQHGELYTLQECYIWENQQKIPKTVLNEAALQTYLSSLTMEELIWHYHFEQSEARFVLCYESDSHTIIISLFDDFAEVATLPPDKEIIQYHISDDIDWDLLNQLTTPS